MQPIIEKDNEERGMAGNGNEILQVSHLTKQFKFEDVYCVYRIRLRHTVADTAPLEGSLYSSTCQIGRCPV